jgi:leucyl aminopeptidase
MPPMQRQWLATLGFKGAPDTHALLPGEDGRIAAVWAGVRAADHPYALSLLPRALPEGAYRLADGPAGARPHRRGPVLAARQLCLRTLQEAPASRRAAAAADGRTALARA